ncbi:MAG: hypothetical protein N838_04130 [Thiohalocapsa sp. PB-PSB1]|nr:MAG: hypothetical protein N838_04130 [Thiohalocapsa sp. PB-PSB1]
MTARSRYETMRRQAMEDARRRWEQAYRMRPPMPVPPYYGYPGSYQGYPGSYQRPVAPQAPAAAE